MLVILRRKVAKVSTVSLEYVLILSTQTLDFTRVSVPQTEYVPTSTLFIFFVVFFAKGLAWPCLPVVTLGMRRVLCI